MMQCDDEQAAKDLINIILNISFHINLVNIHYNVVYEIENATVHLYIIILHIVVMMVMINSYTKSGTWINYQGPDSMRAIVIVCHTISINIIQLLDQF